MFKHRMEMVHNHYNSYLDWLFHWQNVFPLRESTSIMSVDGKDSHLRNSLEVHSLSSKFSFQVKTFQSLVDGLLTCLCFELYFSLFQMFMIKSCCRVHPL